MNIIHLVSNKVWGGGETYALELCRALASEGHNVKVFTRRKTAPAEVFAAEGLLAGTLPLRGSIDFISPLRLTKTLDACQGRTIVHVHNFKDAATALAARRLACDPSKIKIVATRHLALAAKTDKSHTSIYNELDRIIFVSHRAHEEFLSTAPAVERLRLVVIHNGVHLPSPAEPEPHEGLRILYAGRISPEKGLNVLIDALGRCTGRMWHLDVCGDGRSRVVMPIVRTARANGVDARTTWHGHVADIAPMMQAADVVVVPTVAPEAFGLSIVEAMARGKVVITSDNGAQPEIITSGHDGLLVPPGDAQALADAICKVESSPELRRKIGENAAKTAQKFNHDIFYTSILKIYNEV